MSAQKQWLEEYMAGPHHPEFMYVWDSLTGPEQKHILAMMDEFGLDKFMEGYRSHRDSEKGNFNGSSESRVVEFRR